MQATVTHGNASERDELRKLVQPGGFYAADRGYADYSLFREFDEKGVRLIRLQENAAFDNSKKKPPDHQATPEPNRIDFTPRTAHESVDHLICDEAGQSCRESRSWGRCRIARRSWR